MNYISTRDGVQKLFDEEKLDTEKQQELISELLKEFPNSKNTHEYNDYIENPNLKTASLFIETAIEYNLDKISKKENYVDYIANRPKVEKIYSHGLFNDSDDEISLSKVAKEIANHTGNVWTPIISLKREDAQRIDFENANAWKNLIASKKFEIAKEMKIAPENFRWYAAFHQEKSHPHIHMVCYSTNPNEGYLSKKAIENIKSSLTNEMFKQELLPLYSEKTVRRDMLKEESKRIFEELQNKINSDYSNPQLELLIQELKTELNNSKGKKTYAYLKPSVKNLVDKIVDELEKIPEVKNCYDLWYEMQDEICKTYQDKEITRVPLSEQKEFKSMKNMIIKEVLDSDDIEFNVSVKENSNTSSYENRQTSNVGMSVFNIVRNLAKTFDDNFPKDKQDSHQKIDSKLLKKMREKKQAQGQKLDIRELKM